MKRRDLGLHCIAGAVGAALPGFAAAAATPATLLVVGDSLSAEYGLQRGQGWVALLEARLASQKRAYRVVNASISGDTTSGGRARLPALLRQHKPSLVIIELGGNDALRGLPLTSSADNLTAMVKASQAGGAKVLLLGMQVPPNYGTRYGRDFAALFTQVAAQQKTALLPFLLKGVADRPDAEDWFQPDRIHPKARAHPLMLDNVWAVLNVLL